MESIKRRRKILLVEDNKVLRIAHRVALQSTGHDIDVAETGKEALNMCANKEYDLIFMDIRLPDINGIEVTLEIRCLENGKRRVPIIAVTVFPLDYIEEKCLSAGMDQVVLKPVKSDYWGEMIESFAA